MMSGETVMNGAKTDKHVSPFKVMSAPAGYYIGTTWTTCNNTEGCEFTDCKLFGPAVEMPNTRETGYMTQAEAEAYLPEFLLGDMSKER
jgi:hypothetical protein